MNYLFRCLIFFVTNILISQHSFAQVETISDVKIYQDIVKKNTIFQLKKIDNSFKNIQIALAYASVNNFTKEVVYPLNLQYTFLSKPAYKALQKINKKLRKQGLGIKVFDAYRPHRATVKFWQLVPDERYAANPAKGSNHNRGLAIDLTLYNLKTGKDLDMGTGFDNFTEKAHHTYALFSDEILNNRKVLKNIMENFGFKSLETEWWHYTFITKTNYPIWDIDFETLNKN